MVWMLLLGLGATMAVSSMMTDDADTGVADEDENRSDSSDDLTAPRTLEDGDDGGGLTSGTDGSGVPEDDTDEDDADTAAPTDRDESNGVAGQMTGAVVHQEGDHVTVSVGPQETGSLIAVKSASDTVPGDTGSSSATAWRLDLYLLPPDTTFPQDMAELPVPEGETYLFSDELARSLNLTPVASWDLGETGVDEGDWLQGTADEPDTWDTRAPAPQIDANRDIALHEIHVDEHGVIRAVGPAASMNPWADDEVLTHMIDDSGMLEIGYMPAGAVLEGSDGEDWMQAASVNPAPLTLAGGPESDDMTIGMGDTAFAAGDGDLPDTITLDIDDSELAYGAAQLSTDIADTVILDIDTEIPGEVLVVLRAAEGSELASRYDILLVPDGSDALDALRSAGSPEDSAYQAQGWPLLAEGTMQDGGVPQIDTDRLLTVLQHSGAGWQSLGQLSAASA